MINQEKLNKKIILALIDILILNAIKKKSICKQEISNWFLKEFDIPINGSTLYPIIIKLKGNGLIKIRKEGKKKIFYLTPEGEKSRKILIETYSNIHKELLNFLTSKN